MTRANVEVNGIPFSVTRYPQTQTIELDGPDRALNPRDKQALEEAGTALSLRLLESGVKPDNIPPEQDLLMRTLAYLSEAPVGYKIGDNFSEKPVVKEAYPATVESSTRSPVVGKLSPEACKEAALKTGDFRTLAACQRADNDGIWLLPCRSGLRYQSHDARNHCFASYRVYAGPGSGECLGKCGPGCNRVLTWGWTQDCLDHDVCSRSHNSTSGFRDPNCGDEWWEADEDYLNTVKGACSG
ncbi:hypothetical protein [Rubrobacter xylanophilus]|uniref:hypothetical protein n=1 Tax=Rubrobacter xylanophilus TaxID=49319 RepID=UPI001C63CA80|nr:hypothetical protein [Rubrobacter xylanophilus]